jgi:hypothetical protein
MSELINKNQRGIQQLFTTVSAVALFGFVAVDQRAAADTFLTSSDNPPFWIELGGDAEKIIGQTDRWMPPIAGILAGSGAAIRKDPNWSFGLEGKLSYRPEGTDWIVWTTARYGRAQRDENFHTQTNQYSAHAFARAYTGTSRHTENHMIIDFQAGKDFGLGLLGRKGQSIISAGIRIAQFQMKADDFISSRPQYSGVFRGRQYFRTAEIRRRTSALGPAMSWDAAAPIFSNHDAVLTINWGANGAILFGRQQANVNLKTISLYHNYLDYFHTSIANAVRSKRATIPNLGAFASVSYRLPAAKLSIGYRADVFFNAIDGGVGAAHSMSRSFYGPFANISVGIGG